MAGDEFSFLMDALKRLRFTERAQRSMFEIVAGVMYCGNIDIVADDSAGGWATVSSETKSREAISRVSSLLGLDAAELEAALCTQTLHIGGDVTVKRLLPLSALENRDALAKAVYSALFDFILAHLNKFMISLDGSSGEEEKQGEYKANDDVDAGNWGRGCSCQEIATNAGFQQTRGWYPGQTDCF